jgi:hypothetical protein
MPSKALVGQQKDMFIHHLQIPFQIKYVIQIQWVSISNGHD